MSYTSMQLTQQGQGQLTPQEIMLMRPDDHPAAWDIMWNDPAVMQGKVIDYAALDLTSLSFTGLLRSQEGPITITMESMTQ